jgi:hypothetical protein
MNPEAIAAAVPAPAGLELEPAAHLGWGGDFDVYRADGWIERVPRDADVAAPPLRRSVAQGLTGLRERMRARGYPGA